MRIFFMSCVLCLFMTITISAQEDTETFNRLPELLAQVPDTDASRQYFTFADYEAMTLARPDAVRPSNEDEFYSDEPQYQQWFAALQGISSGTELTYSIPWIQSGDEYMGFTFFEMNTSVVYGMPPEEVILLVANYDTDNVVDAHEARDFALEEEVEDYTLICGIDGCDTGQITNIADLYRGYIFGGNLGREQPVLLTGDDIILSSAHLPSVETHIDLITGEVSTLADDPDYSAIAEVSSIGVETVIQGYIFPVSVIVTTEEIVNNIIGDNATEETRDAIIEQLGLNDAENNLPAYDVFAIIDGATDTEQVARVMLVYDNEADAERASEEIALRIDELDSFVSLVPISQLFEDRNATYETSVITVDSQERYVTVLELRAPLATTIDDDTMIENVSSRVYRLLAQMVFQSDTAWLAPNLEN